MKITSKLFSYDQMFKQGQMQIPAGDILQIAELSVIRSGEIAEHIQVFLKYSKVVFSE